MDERGKQRKQGVLMWIGIGGRFVLLWEGTSDSSSWLLVLVKRSFECKIFRRVASSAFHTLERAAFRVSASLTPGSG